MNTLILTLALLVPSQQNEAAYVKFYGELLPSGNRYLQKRLSDGSECDVLTDTHAWEIDFAEKWAEAIGQSLHYAEITNKKPGIVLITDNGKDWQCLVRCARLCGKLGIELRVYPKQSDEFLEKYMKK